MDEAEPNIMKALKVRIDEQDGKIKELEQALQVMLFKYDAATTFIADVLKKR